MNKVFYYRMRILAKEFETKRKEATARKGEAGDNGNTSLVHFNDGVSTAYDAAFLSLLKLVEDEADRQQGIENDERQATEYGHQIAAIFDLPKDSEHEDRYVMQGGYGTKTALGLSRAFQWINQKIDEGREEL